MGLLSNLVNRSNNDSNTATQTVKPVVSEATALSLLAALGALHAVVTEAKLGEELPAFNALSEKQVEEVCSRALRALKARSFAAREALAASSRDAVESVVEVAMRDANDAKRAYDAAPEALRNMLGAFKDTVTIPLAAFAETFPTLSTQELAAMLLGYGFKGNGAERGRNAGKHTAIVVPYVEMVDGNK